MGETRSVTLRLPLSLIQAIDDWRIRNKVATHAFVTQSEAMRRLLESAIATDAAKQFGQPVEQPR